MGHFDKITKCRGEQEMPDKILKVSDVAYAKYKKSILETEELISAVKKSRLRVEKIGKASRKQDATQKLLTYIS